MPMIARRNSPPYADSDGPDGAAAQGIVHAIEPLQVSRDQLGRLASNGRRERLATVIWHVE